MPAKLRAYYQLTKPGIIRGNLLTTVGAFLYGSILHIHIGTLIAICAGTALIIASGCVFNNYFDRDIDKVMKRTRERALVTGEISTRAALIFCALLGLLGVTVLSLYTNLITTLLGVLGFVTYAFVYTVAKRRTVHATLLGAIPGAIPPVAGYTAATNTLDASALVLFLILASWQMVHFYAISIYRLKEYKAARVPLMSVKNGIRSTQIQMAAFAGIFMVAIASLARFGYAGILYLAIMIPLSIWWLVVVLAGPWTDDSNAWARKVFFQSLVVLTLFSIMLSINAWVP